MKLPLGDWRDPTERDHGACSVQDAIAASSSDGLSGASFVRETVSY